MRTQFLALAFSLYALAEPAHLIRDESDFGGFKLVQRGDRQLYSAVVTPKSIPTTKEEIKKQVQAGRKLAQSKAAVRKTAQGTTYTSDAVNWQVSYVMPVKVGSSNTIFNLIVDTGSSNTWVGSNQAYPTSSSMQTTGNSFAVTYGSGSVYGVQYNDTLRIGKLTLTRQGLGSAKSSTGFSDVDGILGIGPVGLTANTLYPDQNTVVPTIIDTAAARGKIQYKAVGVYFAPSDLLQQRNGVVTIGGWDTSYMTSSIFWVPLTKSYPASAFWGCNMSLKAGNKTLMSGKPGIIDTGTTLIYFREDVFNAYVAMIAGAKVDSQSSLLQLPKSSFNSVPTLSLTFGSGQTLQLNKYAQMMNPAVHDIYGLSNDYYYLMIASDAGGSQIYFTLGQKFLERYYSIYDTTGSRMGFARTKNSNPTAIGQ